MKVQRADAKAFLNILFEQPGHFGELAEDEVRNKYGIVFAIPTTDEEADERYGKTLKDLVTEGVKKLTTGPNYQGTGFDESGDLVEDGHMKMQILADKYKPGTRVAGAAKTTIKAERKKTAVATDLAYKMGENAGLSKEEVDEMIAEASAENE